MKYIIIIILALSLPATALMTPLTKNPSKQQTLISNKKTEELRKTIQQKASRQLCDPERELHMPTFY